MYNPYDNDEENRNNVKKMVAYCLCAASVVVLLFLYVLYLNSKEISEKKKAEAKAEQERLEELEEEREALEALGIGKNNLRSEDLDFWDMYEADAKKKEKNKEKNEDDSLGEKKVQVNDRDKTTDETDTGNDTSDKKESTIKKAGDSSDNGEDKEKKEEDEYDDSDHLSVKDKNGNTVYYEIISDVEKNKYDLDKHIKIAENGRLEYRDEESGSSNGLMVSEKTGTVDYQKVKDDDFDFVMVKVAGRGKDNGLITLDPSFITNSRSASEKGLKVGAYFETAAITEDEAFEEGNFTVGAIAQFGVNYPVAVLIKGTDDSKNRDASLTMEQRTKCVKKFLDTVKSYGFTPVVFADRNVLIAGLDLSKLKEYSLILKDLPDIEKLKEPEEDTSSNDTKKKKKSDYTDFPYAFRMWEYEDSGHVDGISGNVELLLEFTDR